MGEVALYSFWRSSCSWRIRAVLELKGIKYEYKPIDIWKALDQKSQSYSKVNPMQKVPCLYIDGRHFFESYNIAQYLEETRPLPQLIPRDTLTRATVREICEMIQSGIQPLQNVGLLADLPFDKEGKLEWANKVNDRGLKALEKKLSACAGQFSVGDAFTLADCFLVPQVFNATAYKVDVTKFPTIARLYEQLLAMEPFIKSHPENQPDAPKPSSS